MAHYRTGIRYLQLAVWCAAVERFDRQHRIAYHWRYLFRLIWHFDRVRRDDPPDYFGQHPRGALNPQCQPVYHGRRTHPLRHWQWHGRYRPGNHSQSMVQGSELGRRDRPPAHRQPSCFVLCAGHRHPHRQLDGLVGLWLLGKSRKERRKKKAKAKNGLSITYKMDAYHYITGI